MLRVCLPEPVILPGEPANTLWEAAKAIKKIGCELRVHNSSKPFLMVFPC